MTDEDRPTDPPGPATTAEDEELDRSVDLRLSLEDRQQAMAWKILETNKILRNFVGHEQDQHKRFVEALGRIETNQTLLGEDIRSVRLEQARHSQELVRLQSCVTELKRDDHMLNQRLDELARRLDAQEVRENGERFEARARITNDAATARAQIATEAGEAREVLEHEASDARKKLKEP
jgi:hypothetical protein